MRSEETIERRRTILRIILFFIIIGTLPFYLIGFWLWGTAPANDSGIIIEETVTTNTPIGNGLTPTNTLPSTWTPRPTSTSMGYLNPTPFQFIPPTSIILTDTPVFIPDATIAPTLTLFPSNTPVPTNPPPPTNTPFPLPTNTPVPTNPPPPTNMPVPTDPPPPTNTQVVPTDPPPPTPLLPPTDTPVASINGNTTLS